MKVRIGVVIPTMFTRKPDRLIRAIASVQQAAKGRCVLSITVVVNSVPPGSAILTLGEDVHILVSGINKGFAPAVNDGIVFLRATEKPDWYLILNDDAILMHDFFVRLSKELDEKKFDAITTKVQTPNGETESVGLRYFPTGLAFPRHEDIRKEDVPLFTGTCVLLSRSRIEQEISRHGYVLNPLFFAYAEDLELSLRILRDGGHIFISNDALVAHEGSKTAKRGSFSQLYYGYRNLILVHLLLWSWKDMFLRLPFLIAGQWYIIAMSLYKRYVLLYPKIWWWIWKNRKAIVWQRRTYAQG